MTNKIFRPYKLVTVESKNAVHPMAIKRIPEPMFFSPYDVYYFSFKASCIAPVLLAVTAVESVITTKTNKFQSFLHAG